MTSSRAWRVLRGAATVLLVILGLSLAYHFCCLPDFKEELARQRIGSGVVVVDRKGNILRIFPDKQDRFGLWVSNDAVPPCLISAVIAAEDKRFFHHPGFDPFAMARALYANVTRRQKRSGASTITQQVVRLLTPRPRSYRTKCIELAESIAMEMQLSKREILEFYVNLAPMGGNIRGAALASRIYFGKNLDQISVPEAATLAALPRSPSRFNPVNADGIQRLMAEKDKILGRMAKEGLVSEDQYQSSLGYTVSLAKTQLPMEAPHFVDTVVARGQACGGRVETSLDLSIQHGMERILQSHANRLAAHGIRQISAIVGSARESAILAMAGSLQYSEVDLGFNNGAMAFRSAGSTLKPFLYAAALEQGHQAVTEIPDTFRSYTTPRGDYLPLNADKRVYGPVIIRSALGNSLNISAVKMLKEVGLEPFCTVLTDLSLVRGSDKAADLYGLGLAVGNLEVSLYHLVQAYGVLANQGCFRPFSLMKCSGVHSVKKIFSEETAYVITHILADPTARMLTFGNPSYFDFGFPVALKTGTSSNFRDSWIVAYTTEHVVGIWAGNFDGRSAVSSTGAGACGPILKDIIRLLYGDRPPRTFQRPRRVKEVQVCSMSGKLASAACRYPIGELAIIGKEPGVCQMNHDREYHDLTADYAGWLAQRETRQGRGRFRLAAQPVHSRVGRVDHQFVPIEIISPHDEDHFVLSPHRNNIIRFQAQTRSLVEHVAWFVDGMEITRTAPPYEFFWNSVRGKHVVLAVTPGNEAARIEITVE
ncbi:MAG: penicillin-binding protein [Thermodesulfobacteriota bacterium]|nr:penicillin-binding protein [Thermodesulfobacteriota bacterium]